MKKIYEKFCNVEEIITGIMFFVICALSFSSAILRKFELPLTWADDISQLLFAWTAFLGADIALRNFRLVGVDIVVKKLPLKVAKILQLIVYAIIIIFLGIMAVYGTKLGIENYARNFQSIYFISYSWVTFSLPAGGILMIISASLKIAKLLPRINDDSFVLARNKSVEDANADSDIMISKGEETV